MIEMEINVLVVSIFIISSVMMCSLLLMKMIGRLSVNSSFNQQIIVTTGEFIGSKTGNSVELFSAEMDHLHTIIGNDAKLNRVYFEDVVSREVTTVDFYNQLIVGRIKKGDDGTFVVEREGVSRAHGRIFLSNGSYYIEDLNSLNHTYLNGIQIEGPRVIYSGYRVTFGSSNYIFYY